MLLACAVVGTVMMTEDETDADPLKITYNITDDLHVSRDVGVISDLEGLGIAQSTVSPNLALKGWTADGNFYAIGLVVSSSLELDAVWMPATYTLTFVETDGPHVYTYNLCSMGEGSEDQTSVNSFGGPGGWIEGSPSSMLQGYDKIAGMWSLGYAIDGGDPVKVGESDLDAPPECSHQYVHVWIPDSNISWIDGDKTYIGKISNPAMPKVGERAGYAFRGWADEAGQIVIQPGDPNDPDDQKHVENTVQDYANTLRADTVLTAVWAPQVMTVTFQAGEWVKTVPVLYGQTVIQPVAPQGFTGWDFDFSVPVTSDVTIAGIPVTPAVPYKMSFIDGDKTYSTDSVALQVPPLASREGYIFGGWQTTVGDDKVIGDPLTWAYTADGTVWTAVWEPIKLHVWFVADTPTTVIVEYGTTVAPIQVPDGYEGWGDFDFTQPITADTTIQGVKAAPPAPTGTDNPMTVALIVMGVVVALMGIGVAVLLKKSGKIVVGRAKKVKTNEDEEIFCAEETLDGSDRPGNPPINPPYQ